MGLETQLRKIKHGLYKREVPREYEPIIENTFFIIQADAYSRLFKSQCLNDSAYLHRKRIPQKALTPMGKFVKDKIRGGTIVDLASNRNRYVPEFAMASGAKGYIGIDIDVMDDYWRASNGFEWILLRSDMLRFVSRLADWQVDCFCITGVEHSPIYGINPERYESMLVQEIDRTLKADGILIVDDLEPPLVEHANRLLKEVKPDPNLEKWEGTKYRFFIKK